ncbi:MAG: hypothetical protein MI802_12725 [Desulfobacterales bacterium]|nr:hypothetical protein [Desulfobacterales bacterium]
MIRIEIVGPWSPPKRRVSPQERHYTSPDGRWEILFHNPDEYVRCGDPVWTLSLLHNGKDVTQRYSNFAKFVRRNKYFIPAQYNPWSFQGNQLVLQTQPLGPVWIYTPDNDTFSQFKLKQSPSTIQWAPDEDRLLLTGKSGIELYDSSNTLIKKHPWKNVEPEDCFAFWTMHSGSFALIVQHGGETEAQIGLYNSHDGSLISQQNISPGVLLPYDKKTYEQIRGEYDTLVGESWTASGELLDLWYDFEYIPDKTLLLLATYRPVGEPYKDPDDDELFSKYGKLICRAQQEWVAVKLNFPR